VQRTFDSFADSFDTVLSRLHYRAPALVVEALTVALGASRGDLDVLDAGVGTGLCGPGLRPYARRLEGVDLSPLMLAKARARAVYDALAEGELVAYMRARPASFDVVVSADTLVYFGALADALAAAAAATRTGGHLVFTLERLDEPTPEGFRLHPHGRYSHTEAYVAATVRAAGFSLSKVTPAQLRLENKLPVHGFVVSARRV
jgi:predicted TPR repeat methyltransferase